MNRTLLAFVLSRETYVYAKFDVLTTTFYLWLQVTWWVGKGNYYVLVACDLKANGTMDHNARTEIGRAHV